MARPKREQIETRAKYYGINATALAKVAKTKLGKIRVQIEKLQEPWLETDPMIEEAVTKTLGAIDDLVKQFEESAAYMNEPIGE
jgi:hypothetical protein